MLNANRCIIYDVPYTYILTFNQISTQQITVYPTLSDCELNYIIIYFSITKWNVCLNETFYFVLFFFFLRNLMRISCELRYMYFVFCTCCNTNLLFVRIAINLKFSHEHCGTNIYDGRTKHNGPVVIKKIVVQKIEVSQVFFLHSFHLCTIYYVNGCTLQLCM